MDLEQGEERFLIRELLGILSDLERSTENREYARNILRELDPKPGDLPRPHSESPPPGEVFTLRIDRKSGSDNLISRYSNQFHIQKRERDERTPSPGEQWLVRVPSRGGTKNLEPLVHVKTIDDYSSKSRKNPVKSGDLEDPDNLNELVNGNM